MQSAATKLRVLDQDKMAEETAHALNALAPPVSLYPELSPPRFRAYSASCLHELPQLSRIPEEDKLAMRVVASVLPFRVNAYVVEELIDWSKVPADPIFQLTFPQRGMLSRDHFDRMAALLRTHPSKEQVQTLARTIHRELNPHPSGQHEHNVPKLDGRPLPGMQHKYRETVLFFPAQGQTCHSYCTFCFRWAQFVGDRELKFQTSASDDLVRYLRLHPDVTDVLVTGGDPLVMKTRLLASYLEPLAEIEHLQNIRLGSKSLSFWPQRFVTDPDADDLLRLIESLTARGKHVAFMAHLNHARELEPAVCREAVRRIRDAGAEIRGQSPILRHINDDAGAWVELWRQEVKLGILPYYMFVERDTGAKLHFELPLVRAYEIYREAIGRVSGLARTARGPSMSAGPGKVEIQGIANVAGEDVFVLRFIQGRSESWVQRPFFAKLDPHATWLDRLVPAFGEAKFFFEDEYRAMTGATHLK